MRPKTPTLDQCAEGRALSTAGGGTALTTTPALIVIPDGVHHVDLIPRNFSTAVVAKLALNPYLTVLKTTDGMVTMTDGSRVLQDGATGTSLDLSSLPTLANGGALYVGSHLPFRGLDVDVGSTNSTASVLTGKYRKTDGTWTTLSITDGTAAAGKTFAQDGQVTWTVPTDWDKKSLREIVNPAVAVPLNEEPMYWTRFEVSVALDASTTLLALLALNRSTAYLEVPSGFAKSWDIYKGPGGVACVEALTDAGTANLIVNAENRTGTEGVAL